MTQLLGSFGGHAGSTSNFGTAIVPAEPCAARCRDAPRLTPTVPTTASSARLIEIFRVIAWPVSNIYGTGSYPVSVIGPWLRPREGAERDQLAAVAASAGRHDEKLLPVEPIGHWRPGLRGGHEHGAHFVAGPLVVRAQHRAPLPGWRREEPPLASNHERLRHEHSDPSLPPGPGNRQPFERRMVPDVVRRLAVG